MRLLRFRGFYMTRQDFSQHGVAFLLEKQTFFQLSQVCPIQSHIIFSRIFVQQCVHQFYCYFYCLLLLPIDIAIAYCYCLGLLLLPIAIAYCLLLLLRVIAIATV